MHSAYNIVNNKQLSRFEIAFENGEFAVLQYRWLKGNMVLMHTIVPNDMRKQGIGAELVKYVLDYARANDLKIRPYCPFVAKYIKEHPEYEDLVDKSTSR